MAEQQGTGDRSVLRERVTGRVVGISVAAALGGFLFGFGMTLSSGCGSKTLIRAGAGNLKSVVVVIVLGIAAAGQAFVGWARNERAMREGRPLHGAVTASVLTVVLVLTTVLLALAIFVL